MRGGWQSAGAAVNRVRIANFEHARNSSSSSGAAGTADVKVPDAMAPGVDEVRLSDGTLFYTSPRSPRPFGPLPPPRGAFPRVPLLRSRFVPVL